MKCSLFLFFLFGYSLVGGGGGESRSGSGSKFNRALGSVGLGQTISGTGRVRASVLSPCRPLILCIAALNWSLVDKFGTKVSGVIPFIYLNKCHITII